ncbi:hypothetical protein ASF61_05960 [Duganella sp. Leaf126]|uniref:hypothetical protein n=1 Tax=Duganella sp. Leaf126 TaxID=1736266 RepID=UPI0007004B87|nr:hypothetical protein [Duganella sp. Leaf126]KQQ40315.1 hypothetical protein ASF61_05960 [Duganella sp. Leaf126]
MNPNPATVTAAGAAARKTANSVALPYWIAEMAQIRTAVLTALAAVVIGATLVAVTLGKRHDADEDLRHAQRLRDAAHSRYAHVDIEKRDIRNFQQRYLELRQRGLIGEERRLEWVDAIRQVQDELQLPPLSYQIEPQQAVRLEAALDLGDYQLRGSRMRLHMELLHEMDLFEFLGGLHARGFFAAQDCSLKRLAAAAGGQRDQAGGAAAAGGNLGVDCTLNWITMVPAARPAQPVALATGRQP